MGSSVSKKSSPSNSHELGRFSPRLEQLRATRTTRAHVQCMARAGNRFALQLYQEFATGTKRAGNFVFSPPSLCIGLGMVCLGAKGATREELYRCLYLQETDSEHRLAAYAALHWDVTKSSTPKGCIFESIVDLSAPEGHRITSEYSETCVRYQLTPFRNVDLAKRPDLARKDINKWAQLQTSDRITDVVPIGMLDRGTKLFMLCALYLRVEWLHAFSTHATVSAKFTPCAKESMRVHMMRRRGDIHVGTSGRLDCDVIEIPLSNHHTKFCILMPRKPEGLVKLEGRLSRETVEAALDSTTPTTVDLYLPKFRYELGMRCRETLERLGICSVFVPGQADLSDMDGTRLLHLSAIYHHIELEFSEHGSESSKKQKVQNNKGSSECKSTRDNEVRTLRVDRPFIFLIIDERTSAILVIGRVVRPLAA